MTKMFMKTFILIVALLHIAKASKRKIEVSLNPNCNDQCINPNEKGSYVNLVYVTAKSDKDIIHYLYSNIDAFSTLILKTDLNAQLSINWKSLLSNNATEMLGSINVTGSLVTDMSGYVFPEIYEFNDVNGVADMTQIPANETIKFSTSNLIWSKFNSNISDAIGYFEAKTEINTTGSFKFIIRQPGSDSRDKQLPHLLLTPESSSLDFVIDSITPSFSLSKFGLEILFLSKSGLVNYKSITTMDDEYTPGTFKLWNFELLAENSTLVQSFLQYKPIFYFNEPRSLENSTLTKQYSLLENLEIPQSIGCVFFDQSTLAHAMNVSFGIEGNEKEGFFYKQANYTVWSISIGLGAAPVEKMSFVVTVVILVGFGLPALIIVIGLFVMLVKKIKNSRRSEFEEL